VRRYLVCTGLALLTAIVAPRLLGPRSRPADAPFVYTPPDGFVEKKASSFSRRGARDPAPATTDGMKVWVFEEDAENALNGNDVRAILHHSSKEMSVEEADLATLALEMPKAFEDSCSWVHRRHELRTLASGARVGLIEGDCTRDVELGSLGLPPQKVRARKLQLMFPDDSGTSIVTASYPIDHAARWEPLFEATIGKARGVATRVPAPPFFVQVAWGFAGAVLGWFALALVGRRRAAT
jgi:hypothetical protein